MEPNLFWQHPAGDRSTVPCVHKVREHPGGHEVDSPCRHFPPHRPPWHKERVDCAHFVDQHKGGDEGPRVPCVHPMAPTQTMNDVGLVFYTNDQGIINAARSAALKLRSLGVEIGQPRQLHIFNQAPMFGDPNDSSDPMWSHYNPSMHAVQVTQGHPIDTLLHEMGHAILGHQCVKTPGGGPHKMFKPSLPGVAMSEGWAHFVALVIKQTSRSAPAPEYKGLEWETRLTTIPKSTESIPKDPNIEYNVGCTLWDLFDTRAEVSVSDGRDRIGFSFGELFKVYSPTLQTLPNGPVNWNLDDYLQRLKNNNPSLSSRIDQVRRLNCG